MPVRDALRSIPELVWATLMVLAALGSSAGTLPGILPQFVAYMLYRWEMNIRMAAILGFVGAGGLGQLLCYELSLLHQPQACPAIIAMLLLTSPWTW